MCFCLKSKYLYLFEKFGKSLKIKLRYGLRFKYQLNTNIFLID